MILTFILFWILGGRSSSSGTKMGTSSVSNKSAQPENEFFDNKDFDDEESASTTNREFYRVPVKGHFDKKSCPICGAEVQPEEDSCIVCGYNFSENKEVAIKKIEQKKKICRHCGAEVQLGEVYCAECGYEA